MNETKRWNRPDAENVRTGNRKPFPTLRVAVVAVAILAGAVAAWMLWPTREAGPVAPHPQTNGGGVAVSAATNAPAPVARKPAAKAERTWRPKTVPDVTANVKPPARSDESRLRFKEACGKFFGRQIFTQPSDNIIAGVLSAQPGTRFLPIEIGEQFDKDFAESLKHPITMDEADTPDERQLKEAVIAAREMLKESMAKGVSPSDVVREAREETDSITEYREKLNDNLMLILQGGTEEDVTRYMEESNALLAEYGAMPLHISKFGWKRLRKRLEEEASGAPRRVPSL